MKPNVKPGWKTTEFWLLIVIVAPAVTAMVEALQKGDTGMAALLAGIQAAVTGAYAIARGMAKAAASEAGTEEPPVIVPGPDKDGGR